MIQKRTVCVVEDDPAIRRGLVDSLQFAGFSVLECADGASAQAALARAHIDLLLLDVVVPGMDGLDFLPTLRRDHPQLPVIMVTARGAEEDRVRGLRHGADDYVVKPFSPTELLARVEAVLRRSPERPMDVSRARFEGGAVDVARQEVILDGGETRPLAEREIGVLLHLLRHPGRAVEREELLRCVWGLDPRGLDTRTVDMAVARLRDKLGPSGSEVVRTVRGKGNLLGDGVESIA